MSNQLNFPLVAKAEKKGHKRPVSYHELLVPCSKLKSFTRLPRFTSTVVRICNSYTFCRKLILTPFLIQQIDTAKVYRETYHKDYEDNWIVLILFLHHLWKKQFSCCRKVKGLLRKLYYWLINLMKVTLRTMCLLDTLTIAKVASCKYLVTLILI